VILVNEPLLVGNEKKYLQECIDSGWISSEGPFVKEFEEKFAASVHRKHGIAVCNGSVALDLAVYASGISPGDEIIMPAFTIISPAAAAIRCGAIPVLVDSDPDTWNMSVNEVERRITKKTRAIIIVHIYGLPVDVDPILAVAKKHNLIVIEDAAEMHGQFYKGNPCGSFGDISTFSFYPNKHITTGEGGMIVTDNPELDKRCRLLRNLAFTPERRFVHEELGWNYRFTNLQAAVGLAQLELLDKFVERKRRMGNFYNRLLKDLSEYIALPLPSTHYAENIYWVYGLLLTGKVNGDATLIMTKLHELGIGTRPFFYPMHKQPVFRKMGLFSNECYPVAEYMAEKGFYIPSGLALTDKQMLIVSEKLHDLFHEYF
jgi:perosamine synthetase